MRNTVLSIVVSAITAIISFLAMLYVGIETSTSFVVALGLASASGAIVSIKGDLGQIVGFVALLFALFVLSPLIVPKEASVIISVASSDIVINVFTIPLILIAVCGIVAVVAAIGWDVVRFSLFLLVTVLSIAYYAFSDVTARTIISAIIALTVFYPMITEAERFKGVVSSVIAVPVAINERALYINLSDLSIYYISLVLPLSFIALDPTRRIPKNIRYLSSVVLLFVILLNIIRMVISL